MDRYRKFAVDMTATIIELNRSSGRAQKGMVPVDARLFNETVRLASKLRDTMNHHLEGGLRMELKRLQKRFSLDLAEIDPQPADGSRVEHRPKPKPKPEPKPDQAST
jgi:hypothetical protein